MLNTHTRLPAENALEIYEMKFLMGTARERVAQSNTVYNEEKKVVFFDDIRSNIHNIRRRKKG